jgi:hypothetical protein
MQLSKNDWICKYFNLKPVMGLHPIMEKLLLSLLFLSVLFLSVSSIAYAADVCVGPTSSGNGSGADWNNIAQWSSVSLGRGNTYYLQDGTYAGRTISTSASGTTYINIKKATESAHGPSTGWNSDYGIGVATFTSTIYISAPYLVFDGVTGSGESGHGFHVSMSAKGIGIRVDLPAHDLAIEHTKISWPDVDGASFILSGGLEIYDTSCAGINNVTLRYLYLADIPGYPFRFISVNNLLMEYCVTNRMHSDAAQHASGIIVRNCNANNGVLRYNKFLNTEGSYTIGFYDAAFDNWKIYGNLFAWDGVDPRVDSPSAVISWNFGSVSVTNMKIYNNTFAETRTSGDTTNGKIQFGTTTGNELYNNIFYGMSYLTFSGVIYDYNYYSKVSTPYAFTSSTHDSPCSSGICSKTTDPFVNSSTRDYRLSAPLVGYAGTTLGVPYNIDMLGNTRGADGVWDRGAYEYTGNVLKIPFPPLGIGVN